MKKEELTWEIIRVFLQKELKNSKSIMTWGTIGSLNIEHDIDTIITKKPLAPSAEFFKEIHTIFENLDSYLYKNFKVHAVRFAQATQEFLVDSFTKNKVMFHTMVYISYSEMEKDWNWGLFKDDSITAIIKNNYSCIFGKVENLFNKNFHRENYYENVFIYLYLFDCLNSNLSEKTFLKIMNACFDYLYRKKLRIKNPNSFAKNRIEVKKYFYKLCDLLDDLAKSKKTFV